eukprot:10342208-Lingulodinium_polyedra.AAC.1
MAAVKSHPKPIRASSSAGPRRRDGAVARGPVKVTRSAGRPVLAPRCGPAAARYSRSGRCPRMSSRPEEPAATSPAAGTRR